MAEFDDPSAAVAAARKVYQAGYRRINAYSPYPIEELWEAIGFHKTYVPLVVLICGIIGGLSGFALQAWTSAYDYPINVGGRPLISIPSFVPITFECTILFASFGAFLGNLIMSGFPRPYHPVFNVPSFARASSDRFFVCIKADDSKFDEQKTRAFLEGLGAKGVTHVDE